MAKKKPRTPPPPRRVQAPKQRPGQRKQSAPALDMGMRHRAVLYGVSAAGFVGLIAVVLWIALSGSGVGSTKKLAQELATANCTFRTVTAYVPKGEGTHVPSLTSNDHWNTDPPSNGQHYPIWAPWGFYTQAINPRYVVHNQEHGGVVVWWGPNVAPGTVQKLRDWYLAEPTGSFGTPYPKLGSKVAITAWTGDPSHYQYNGYYGQGHIAICPSYTPAAAKAFTEFRKVYRGHGPEGIPLCDDEPGDSSTKSSC
ncbi:MAG TPA: DUF3105 domain-containing protein [Gaiellaceae bacterium]|nr:DUF3105 domain-containing protein [Gaiellaceae bacterium]